MCYFKQSGSLVILILGVLVSCGHYNQPHVKNDIKAVENKRPASNNFDYSKSQLRLVRNSGKIGFEDVNGKMIIPYIYENIANVGYGNKDSSFFSLGFAKVMQKNKWGIINDSGKVIIPCEYDHIKEFDFHSSMREESPYIEFFSKNLTIVEKGGYKGFMDIHGKIITPCVFQDVYVPTENLFYEGMIGVKKNGKWGFIDNNGIEIIPFQYDRIGRQNMDNSEEFSFSNKLAAVKKDDKWGFIDRKGNIIIPFQYDDVCSFNSTYTKACKNGKWGIISNKNEELVPFEYSEILWEEHTLIPVKKDSNWGFIDLKNNTIIPFLYDNIITSELYGNQKVFFLEGKCVVSYRGKCGLIDTTGKVVLKFDYDEIKYGTDGPDGGSYTFNGYVIVRKGSGFGIVLPSGKEVIPCLYQDAIAFGGDHICLEKNDKWGMVDSTGKVLRDFKYKYMIEALNADYNEKMGR